MIETPGNLLRGLRSVSAEAVVTWSTQELEAEIAQTSADLISAQQLERAAEKRHAVEKRPETELAYAERHSEVDRIRERLSQLLEKLNRRNDGG